MKQPHITKQQRIERLKETIKEFSKLKTMKKITEIYETQLKELEKQLKGGIINKNGL